MFSMELVKAVRPAKSTALLRAQPIEEFGLLSSLAFVLSMIADFTALPAALWFVFRDKPDHLKTAQERAGTRAP